MLLVTTARRWPRALALAALLTVLVPHSARAQGFIAASYGYNFGGDAGCRTATDCRNKNWNWGGSLGALGSIVGFEVEWTHEGEFTGDRPTPISLTTLMGNFMIAPKITIVQPYGLVGLGDIRTKANDVSNSSDDQIGWTIGGGVIVHVAKHLGVKGDVRYYHSFEASDLLGINLGLDNNKVDFGRAGFGVVIKF
jgi:opacity protein-like surface antigen